MDEKKQTKSQRGATNTRTGRRGLARIVAATFLTALFSIVRAGPSYAGQGAAGNSEIVLGNKVPLEVHIVSKCPDTRDALRELILPVMQRVSDKVDFKLSYIGKYVYPPKPPFPRED